MMATAGQETTVFYPVNNDRMCFSSILIHYFKKMLKCYISLSSTKGQRVNHKQEVMFVFLIT